jgi:cAMP-dependent protein kinase regulator
MSTSNPSADSIPSLQQEFDALTAEIQRFEPRDVLQYCANYFNRRLEAERAQHLTKLNSNASSGSETNGTTQKHPSGSRAAVGMAEGSFPGGSTSPFGSGSGPSSGMRPVAEEDENDTMASPTDAHPAASSNRMAQSSSPPPSSSSGFGNFGGFGAATGSKGTVPPSSGAASGGTDQQFPTNYNLNRRTSVSAESLNPASASDGSWTPPFHRKTAEQQSRLQKAVQGNFLFSHLDDEQSAQVLGALQEKTIPAKGVKVIVQGDVGDYFYVVEKGQFDIYVSKTGKVESGSEGMGERVGSVGPGGSFGELALMYNAPRAATVVSTEPAVLWQLDRVTFRRILMDSAFQRRRMYEGFLGEVEILKTLTSYERSKIADALETQKYPSGSTIIREGEPGTNFFILENGEAEVYKKGTNEDKPVAKYKKGDYFGELALLNDAPRAASVVAVTDVKVASLGKEGFQRLLGPVESIMRRKEYGSGDGTASGGVDPLAK